MRLDRSYVMYIIKWYQPNDLSERDEKMYVNYVKFLEKKNSDCIIKLTISKF